MSRTTSLGPLAPLTYHGRSRGSSAQHRRSQARARGTEAASAAAEPRTVSTVPGLVAAPRCGGVLPVHAVARAELLPAQVGEVVHVRLELVVDARRGADEVLHHLLGCVGVRLDDGALLVDGAAFALALAAVEAEAYGALRVGLLRAARVQRLACAAAARPDTSETDGVHDKPQAGPGTVERDACARKGAEPCANRRVLQTAATTPEFARRALFPCRRGRSVAARPMAWRLRALNSCTAAARAAHAHSEQGLALLSTCSCSSFAAKPATTVSADSIICVRESWVRRSRWAARSALTLPSSATTGMAICADANSDTHAATRNTRLIPCERTLFAT